MGEEPGTGRQTVNDAGESGAAASSGDPEEIRAEIEETRRELGDTVAALSAKTDVKAQAKERIEDAKAGVNEKKDEFIGKAREFSPESAQQAAATGAAKARENPLPVAAVGAFLAGFILGRLTAR